MCKTAFKLDICLNNTCYGHLRPTLSPLKLGSGMHSKAVAVPDAWKGKIKPKEPSNILYTQFTFSPELVLCQFKEEEGALG